MLIGLSDDMTAIDFCVTRSKVKVTRVLFVKTMFLLIFLKTIYHSAIIFHMLVGVSDDLTAIDLGFSRLKVTLVICKKCKRGLCSLS